MKRKAAWLIVPLILGAVIYGAKYQLDHPPLSRADRQLRRTLQGADEVVIIGALANTGQRPVLARLKGAQIQELAELLRLTDANCYSISNYGDYAIRITRQKKPLGEFDVFLASWSSASVQSSESALPFRGQPHYIHPRFVPRLRAYLKQVINASN